MSIEAGALVYITQWQPEVDFGLGTSVSFSVLLGAMVMAELRPLMGCDAPPCTESVNAD